MSNEKIPVIPQPRVKKKSNKSRRILILLFLFFITIFLILFLHSDLSKVTQIDIEGLEYGSQSDIEAVVGLEKGDSFFFVQTSEIEQRVKSLRVVKNASVTKNFPGHITIQVEEYPAVAMEYASNGEAMIVLANGENVNNTSDQLPLHLPILSGWEVDDPIRLRLCETLADIPDAYLADVSEILPIPTVSYPDKLLIYTRSTFEVITSVQYMPEMMSVLDNVIFKLKQDDVNTGQITMLETITWSSFEQGQSEEETNLEQLETTF